jgi:exodeoxyribonuclease VII large subunit
MKNDLLAHASCDICYNMNADWSLPKRHIYTVSELTQNIKEFLEDAFPFVWVAGEVSNLRQPGSGHLYFTLKDPKAQISAVVFRGQTRSLKFDLGDGMSVIAMGRVNVYVSRGTYQIIVEYLEPGGLGALQLAFEQLKDKLSKEGLFDDTNKQPIPSLPRTIAVITSPSGAVIQDFLNVTQRRFPNLAIEILPVKVQGEGSIEEIVHALELANNRASADLVVLARGGGSLEDLQAFNSEAVARAIYSSNIPVVSAIGHETDYTISDFTADLRAPTPSAAAELVVPEKQRLLADINRMRSSLMFSIKHRVRLLSDQTRHLSKRLVHPKRRIIDYRLQIDDLVVRADRAYTVLLQKKRDRVRMLEDFLARRGPSISIKLLNNVVEKLDQKLRIRTTNLIKEKRGALQVAKARLETLNPLAVLDRGYSITRRLADFSIIKDVAQIGVGESVAVKVAKGEMVCRVERK